MDADIMAILCELMIKNYTQVQSLQISKTI